MCGEISEMSRGMKNEWFDCWLMLPVFLASWSVQAKVPGGMSDLKVVLVSAL